MDQVPIKKYIIVIIYNGSTIPFICCIDLQTNPFIHLMGCIICWWICESFICIMVYLYNGL